MSNGNNGPTDSNATDETYLFEMDAGVCALIGQLYTAIGHPEDGDDDDRFEAFEAEVHSLLNRYAPKK